MLLIEKVILKDRILEIELHSDGRYCLRCGDVEYTNGRRTVRGRVLPYEFRSVEQLRYDFERDAQVA
jgi:hypothetical protein